MQDFHDDERKNLDFTMADGGDKKPETDPMAWQNAGLDTQKEVQADPYPEETHNTVKIDLSGGAQPQNSVPGVVSKPPL